jgi:hypothetical protein
MLELFGALMEPLVGIQIGAISFVDEGVPELLGQLQELASVNAVFVATQSFDRGVQGRQVPGRPWPGHGPQEPDDHAGGSYVTQHPEFYADTVLKPFPATDREVAGTDVLAKVLPEAGRLGIKVYSFLLENTHSGLTRAVPNWPKVLQVDAWGRADSYACVRNPDYITWWLSLVEDQVKSYELDGLMFGSERGGPLGNVLGDGGFARDGRPYCFCSHCLRAGLDRGIDPARAREGYLALYRLARGEDDPDGDSGFVAFLRLLVKYPEILAWERLWHDGYQALQQRIYGTVKFLAPGVQVGWHVWHHNSFSPLYRAEMSFGPMAAYSDFIKPVLYDACAGYRIHDHITQVARSIFRGTDPQTLYDLYRQALGYDEAAAFHDLPARGLSADYVRRETARTVSAVAGQAAVYPGLDAGVSTPAHVRQVTPDDISASVTAALDAGADGFILSRKYSEMRLDTLAAAGSALRRRP